MGRVKRKASGDAKPRAVEVESNPAYLTMSVTFDHDAEELSQQFYGLEEITPNMPQVHLILRAPVLQWVKSLTYLCQCAQKHQQSSNDRSTI